MSDNPQADYWRTECEEYLQAYYKFILPGTTRKIQEKRAAAVLAEMAELDRDAP